MYAYLILGSDVGFLLLVSDARLFTALFWYRDYWLPVSDMEVFIAWL